MSNQISDGIPVRHEEEVLTYVHPKNGPIRKRIRIYYDKNDVEVSRTFVCRVDAQGNDVPN